MSLKDDANYATTEDEVDPEETEEEEFDGAEDDSKAAVERDSDNLSQATTVSVDYTVDLRAGFPLPPQRYVIVNGRVVDVMPPHLRPKGPARTITIGPEAERNKRGRVASFGADHNSTDLAARVTLPAKRSNGKAKAAKPVVQPSGDGWHNSASSNQSDSKKNPVIVRRKVRAKKPARPPAVTQASQLTQGDVDSDIEVVKVIASPNLLPVSTRAKAPKKEEPSDEPSDDDDSSIGTLPSLEGFMKVAPKPKKYVPPRRAKKPTKKAAAKPAPKAAGKKKAAPKKKPECEAEEPLSDGPGPSPAEEPREEPRVAIGDKPASVDQVNAISNRLLRMLRDDIKNGTTDLKRHVTTKIRESYAATNATSGNNEAYNNRLHGEHLDRVTAQDGILNHLDTNVDQISTRMRSVDALTVQMGQVLHILNKCPHPIAKGQGPPLRIKTQVGSGSSQGSNLPSSGGSGGPEGGRGFNPRNVAMMTVNHTYGGFNPQQRPSWKQNRGEQQRSGPLQRQNPQNPYTKKTPSSQPPVTQDDGKDFDETLMDV